MSYQTQLYKARAYAIEKHNGQQYGSFPYQVHLGNVISVLMRFSVFPVSQEHYHLLAGAWLHDVLEDTAVSKEELEKEFGTEIADIVNALSDEPGANRKERKDKMYQKLVKNHDAIIVKLADRIANTEFSLINGNTGLYKMYQAEQADLEKKVGPFISSGLAENLLNYLKELMRQPF